MHQRYGTDSILEQCVEIAATVRHAENQHISLFDAVYDHIFADGEAPRTGAEVVIASTAYMRVGGNEKEPGRNGIDQAIGTSALPLSLAT
jgi:hypothetical protein